MDAKYSLFRDMPSQWDNPNLTDIAIENAQKTLGYKLPSSYLEVLRVQNGGIVHRTVMHIRDVEGQENTISIMPLMGIGGEFGIDSLYNNKPRYVNTPWSQVLIDQWGFPNVGVVFSYFGHAGFLFDYNHCGSQGEPRIIFADAEQYPTVYVYEVAKDFSSLLSMLF